MYISILLRYGFALYRYANKSRVLYSITHQ